MFVLSVRLISLGLLPGRRSQFGGRSHLPSGVPEGSDLVVNLVVYIGFG